jgi:hypothetical protein
MQGVDQRRVEHQDASGRLVEPRGIVGQCACQQRAALGADGGRQVARCAQQRGVQPPR